MNRKSWTSRVSVFTVILACSLLQAAIAEAQLPPPAAAPTAAPAAAPAGAQEADTIWQQRCSTCHGPNGKGDGPAGSALTPKPRDFTLASWQASVTDEHIEKIIAEGGQSVGLSMLMPANPDLVSKPEVIKALRAHVRGLAGK